MRVAGHGTPPLRGREGDKKGVGKKSRGIFAEQKGVSPTVCEKVNLKFKAGNGNYAYIKNLIFKLKLE
jgi:hypothetical protein